MLQIDAPELQAKVAAHVQCADECVVSQLSVQLEKKDDSGLEIALPFSYEKWSKTYDLTSLELVGC